MKRLIDIPHELDVLIIEMSKTKSFPISQVIKQILWQYFEKQSTK